MKKYISLGNCDKYQVVFLLGPIIFVIIKKIIVAKTISDTVYYDHLFVNLVSASFGKVLSFFPFIILRIRSKNTHSFSQLQNNKAMYKKEYYERYKKIILKKYILIFISTILNVLSNLLSMLFSLVLEDSQIDFLLFDIIMLAIFVKLIFGTELYRHQYFSMAVIFIVGITKNLVNLDKSPSFINILNRIIYEIDTYVNIIFYKYLMDIYYCSPYELCFYQGVISTILSIIIFIFVAKVKQEQKSDLFTIYYKGYYYIDNYYKYLEFLGNTKELWTFIILTLDYAVVFLFNFLIIKYFSVFHYLIISITNIANHDLVFYTKPTLIIFNASCLIIVLFMFFVFNEFIEINCFDLEKNTKRNITKRASEDDLVKNIPLVDVNNRTDSMELEGYIIDIDRESKNNADHISHGRETKNTADHNYCDRISNNDMEQNYNE